MATFELLQASVDDGAEPSEFRILVDGAHIKYLTIDAGLYPPDDMCFAPALTAMLPPLPPGPWNVAHISRSPPHPDGRPAFTRTAQTPLPGVSHTWHARRIDYMALHRGAAKLRANVYQSRWSRGPGDPPRAAVVKFARFAWEIPMLDAETRAYEWIEGHAIGPAFLGHVLEDDRVIGFVLAHIPDARPAGLEDIALCREVLARLHGLGIKHGDVNRHNFLVHDGRATLIDFDHAERCENADELEAEMRSLEVELCDTSGRGSVVDDPEED